MHHFMQLIVVPRVCVDISKCFYFVFLIYPTFFAYVLVFAQTTTELLFFSCTRLLHTYNCAAAATAFLHYLRCCSDM